LGGVGQFALRERKGCFTQRRKEKKEEGAEKAFLIFAI
jgi:hypothetical protein